MRTCHACDRSPWVENQVRSLFSSARGLLSFALGRCDILKSITKFSHWNVRYHISDCGAPSDRHGGSRTYETVRLSHMGLEYWSLQASMVSFDQHSTISLRCIPFSTHTKDYASSTITLALNYTYALLKTKQGVFFLQQNWFCPWGQ